MSFDFNSWLKAELSSPFKKRKREESSEEREVKQHKLLDDRDFDKIEEDRHELKTKKSTAWAMSVLKDRLEEKNMSSDLFNCSAESLNKVLRSCYPSV